MEGSVWRWKDEGEGGVWRVRVMCGGEDDVWRVR